MNTAQRIEDQFKAEGVEIKLTEAEKQTLRMREVGAGRDNAQKQWNGRVYKFWSGQGSKTRKTKTTKRTTARDRRIKWLKEALERGLIDAKHQPTIYEAIHSLEDTSSLTKKQKQIYQCVKTAVKKARTKEYFANKDKHLPETRV